MGSWTLYGLGSESESLPGYVVMPDPDGALEAGSADVYQRLPAGGLSAHDVARGQEAGAESRPAGGITPAQRKNTLNFIRELNQATMHADDDEFAARISAYDLAFKMQTEAPDIFDLRTSPNMSANSTASARTTDRRLRPALPAGPAAGGEGRAIRDVSSRRRPGHLQWDAHDDIEENHLRMAAQTDQPVAGLLKDLKRRGLLDSTLVLWGGEFGRSPEAQGGKGRDHHNLGFTMWMAGGGISGGSSSARPTPSACMPSRSRTTSATFTRRS